jgi:hypothetical protein
MSGNRIVDLCARWKSDAPQLKPDAISILVGVNDKWYQLSSGHSAEVPCYATINRPLLQWTQSTLLGVKLLLCEPFVLPCGVVGAGWREEIEERRQAVKQLAVAFDRRSSPSKRLSTMPSWPSPRTLGRGRRTVLSGRS